MRASKVDETLGEAGLATKLEDEATAWRKRRNVRPQFTMAGVRVVRIRKRRPPSAAMEADASRLREIDLTSALVRFLRTGASAHDR
jgi:hypothetical protein